MLPRDFPPGLDLGPPVIAVPGEVDWGSGNAYLITPTHVNKGTYKYTPPPVHRSPIMQEYYRLHPGCNTSCIRHILNLCLQTTGAQLSKADPTKLRDAYKILVESSQKIDVILEEDVEGLESEYFKGVFVKDKLETQGNEHVRYVKVCLDERAELVKNTLLDMDCDFAGYFRRGKQIPDTICRSRVKCQELLEYGYGYLNWHYKWPRFTETTAGFDMSLGDVQGMERAVAALDIWMKKYRRSHRWMKRNRGIESETTNKRVFKLRRGYAKIQVQDCPSTPVYNYEDYCRQETPSPRPVTPVYAPGCDMLSLM